MASQKSTAWTKLGQTDDEPDASDVLKDGYDYFFIEGGGGGPESLLRALGIGSLPNTTYYDIDNGLISNNTLLAQNLSIQNGSFIAETPNDGSQPLAEVIVMTVTSVVLGLMILITVIGNVFVIAAIILERNLQNVANYLVASLAVADLMVACLVMPLGAVYEISKGWILGPELCDMWTSSDVLCCTASILHLVAIAVDRYWAVTNVDYIHNRTGNRIFIMIFIVWTVAVIVSLAPQFGWKDPDYLDRINLQQRCLVSQDVGYQIFATCSTFYVPLFVILVLYWKIFQTARKRIRRRTKVEAPSTQSNNNKSAFGTKVVQHRFLRSKRSNKKKQSAATAVLSSSLMMMKGNSTNTMNTVEDQEEQSSSVMKEEQTAFTIDKPDNINESPEKTSTNDGSASHVSEGSHASHVEASRDTQISHVEKPLKKKESIEAKRERKAAKTLAIITGAFVICWLPFFIMALLMPLCESCSINDYVASFFLWLGYFNSTLNPVIYTIFSPEFRQAFKRILFGGHRNYYRTGRL